MADKFSEMFSVTTDKFRGLVDANSVVGEPVITHDGTMIIPISKLTFGFGGGGAEFDSKKNTDSNFSGGMGGGASVQAEAFLVINKGNVRLIPMGSGGSPVDKIIDMVPSALDKVNGFLSKSSDKKAAKKAAKSGAVDAAGEIYDKR